MQTHNRTEESLLAEIEELKRKLHTQEHHPHISHKQRKRPSAASLWVLGFLTAGIIVAAFFTGYLPQASRQTALAKEAAEDSAALPPVNVAIVDQASGKSQLILPGNIQAVTEAPILARASGYIKTRLADIGDRVKEGQLLAEIDAGELDQQVRQAKATVDQANSSLEQANANLKQGTTNAEMARITYERWNALVQRGAVSKQDADTYKSQAQALSENVQALEKGVAAAKSSIAAAEANQARL